MSTLTFVTFPGRTFSNVPFTEAPETQPCLPCFVSALIKRQLCYAPALFCTMGSTTQITLSRARVCHLFRLGMCHETNLTRARCYASNAIFILIGCYYDIPPFRENDSKCSKLHLLNQVSVENENVFQVLMPLIGCIYSKNMSVFLFLLPQLIYTGLPYVLT